MTTSFAKRLKIVVAVILTPILVCIVGLMLTACSPQDIKYDKAISIAKKDYDCEKILWITDSVALTNDPWDTIKDKINRVHYSFYVVGEKAGKEVYIIIPSPQIEDPFITTWALDYSFSQVVDKFNENGAQYVADVPDDYYSRQGSYIKLIAGSQLDNLDEYYDVDGDGQTFSNRLDVKAAFEYEWEADGVRYSCIVTQENGELKAYKEVRAI